MAPNRGADGRFVSGNGVTIGVGVDDKATNEIKGIAASIKSSMNSVQGSITRASSGIAAGVTGSISRMVTGLAVATAVIGAGAIAFGDFGTGFNKAADLQTSQITSAYTLATMIGSTVTDAKTAIKDLNKEMIKLGDTLPGVTEDYQKFANTLTPTISGVAKGDMNKYKSLTMEASKYGGLMTAVSHGDAQQNSMTLNRYLSGTMSNDEARRHEMFAKNATYFTFQKQAMKQMGLTGKDFEHQLTTAQRTAVHNLTGSLMFTPAMIAAYGNTADTAYQNLKSKMFNPVTGVFGFAREIKGLDGRSALDTVVTMMGQLDIMGTQAGKWLSAHGINLDPMEAIGHMMDNLSGWASAFTAAMKGDKSGINTMVADIAKGFKSIKIEKIVGVLNLMISGLSGAIAGVDWSNFGANLADGLAKAMQAFDWVKAGNTLDQAYFAAVTALAEFIRTSGNHLNRALSKATGYTDDKSTPAQKAAMDKDDKVKHQFFDNLFGGNRLDPEKSKGAKDITGQPLSSLPSLGQMTNNNGSVFSPVINITGGMADGAQQTADYVLEAINNRYLQYRQEALV